MPAIPDQARGRAHLLVVDDVASNIEALVGMLEDDYEIRVATSGPQALELIARSSRPDLILLDVMMPEMDGYEVCAALKAQERTRDIPIIFVTARTDAASESRAIEAGAVDFIHKPVNKTVVRARVRMHLENVRRAAELARSEARARAFMNTAMDAVVVIDPDGTVVEFNPAGERMFGYPAAEVLGGPLERLLPLDATTRSNALDALGLTTLDGSSLERTIPLSGRRKDGTEFPAEVTVGSILAARRPLYVGIVRDVTERREAERQLAEAKAREAGIAAAIQKRLLLRDPPRNLTGFSVACRTDASQVVGGDFYTFTELGPSRFEVLVADVMGKGVQAALLASGLKSTYRRLWFELMAGQREPRLPTLAELVDGLHASLTPELIKLESFVTVAMLRFDASRGILDWVNAGHTPILVARADGGTPFELRGDNLPLGVLEDERYEEHRVQFAPGDTFLVYSDGLTETFDAQGREYGTEPLTRMLAAGGCEGASAAEILARILTDLGAHAAGAPATDDRTLVVVRAEGNPGPAARSP